MCRWAGVAFFFDGGPGGGASSTKNVFDANWHHVAGVKRGNTAELWIDGHLEQAATLTLVSTVDKGGFAIGRDGECCEFFNGLMDEVKIWNRALSKAEIQAEAAH